MDIQRCVACGLWADSRTFLDRGRTCALCRLRSEPDSERKNDG